MGDGLVVPVENIISTDYVGDGQIGSVTFWVDSLSVFGIGSSEESESTPADTDGTGSTLGIFRGRGCFITAVTD